MEYTREKVLASALALFGEGDLAAVLALLDQYGAEPYEREVDRVKLEILALSEGKLEKLEYFVKCAKVDYRDVLIGRRAAPMSPEEEARWLELARRLMASWRKK